jgi:antitoxin VapB
MPLNIEDTETDQLVRQLAAVTGEKITDAVKNAVREKLARELRRRDRGSLDRIRAIVRAYQAKPVVDERSVEELLYDERGLPR